MDSVNKHIESINYLSPREPSSGERNKASDLISYQHPPQGVTNIIEKKSRPRLKHKSFLHSMVLVRHSKNRYGFVFAIFTAIIMTIGILTVCYTSPKPLEKPCSFILKSEAKTSIIADSHPQSIAVAHFNNDGMLDFVVANSGTDTIGIFLRNHDSSFTHQITYSTDFRSYPCAVATGDFNKDQQQDIVVANFGTNNIGIFFGIGNGIFQSQVTFSTGSSRPIWVGVNDFNNDSTLDIAVVNYGTDSIGIFLGYNNGTFANQITCSTGYDSYPVSLVIGDFNNDDKLDIAVANSGTNNVGIFLGYGNGTFTMQMIFSTGIDSHPISIATEDFDKDTYLDVVIVNYGKDNVAVLYGYGNGSFTVPIEYSTGNFSLSCSVVVGDFDDDKQTDIAVANYGTHTIGIFFGHENGIFYNQMVIFASYADNPYSIIAADFNNDTRLDIAVINSDKNYVDILLNYKNTSFLSPIIYPTTYPNSNPMSIVIADFNNDSQSDMVIANYRGKNIEIFLGYGNGTFLSGVTYSTGSTPGPYDVAVGDVNNDNRLDIVVANYNNSNIGIFLGHGNGSFSAQMTYSTGTNSFPLAVALGDLNNDKLQDIVVANYGQDNIGVFLGHGNNTFSNQTTFPTGAGSYPYDIGVGDFNNDSQLDIAVINRYTYTVGIFRGFGNGNFSNQSTYGTGSSSAPCALTINDLNKDGRLDIVIGICYTYVIGILLGYGNGTFASLVTYSTGTNSWPNSVVTGDWNGDDQVDIAVANRDTDDIGIFFGNGDGTFLSQITYPTGTNSHPTSIAIGHFDNDTLLDVVVTNSDTNSVGVFLAFTYISGIREDTYSTGSSSHPRSVALGDFNNDAQVDIVVANYGLGNIEVLFKDTGGIFSMKTQLDIDPLSFPTSIAVGDFDNNNELDIAVANSGTENIGIFYRYKNGTYTNLTMHPTGMGSIPQSIVPADFNNDNKLDIAVANDGTNNVNVLLRYDSGAFKQQIVYRTGTDTSPIGVAIGDFNNDRRLDFVVANKGTHNLGIFFQLKDGTFSTPMIYSTGDGSSPWGVTVADLNHDNHLDIVVANYWHFNVGVILGYGNGTFMNQMTYPTGYFSYPRTVAIADFNNDSHLDIVVSNFRTHNMGVFLGHGNGTFSSQMTYSAGADSFPSSLAIGEFNSDHHLDIVIANSEKDNIGIFLGSENGTFSTQITLYTGNHTRPYAVAVGDFNNDSRHDIVVANYLIDSIGVMFGYGNGAFSSQMIYSTGTGSGPRAIGVADLNNDNQLDIAVVNFNNDKLSILLGCTNGTFFDQLTHSIGDFTSANFLIIGDLNQDNRLDIIVSKYGTNSIGLFLGYADESFLSAPSYSTGLSSRPAGIAVGDFDNDTHLDIVVANNDTNNIMVLFGSGYGTFIRDVTYFTGYGSHPKAVAVADINKDSWPDVVVANAGTNNVGVFLSNRNGTFLSQATYFSGLRSQPNSVVVVDFDNDTQLDIVVANYRSDSVGVFFGYGNGSFASQRIFNAGFSSRPFALVAGDINKDNLTDVVATNDGYGNIDILLKTC